MIAVTWPSELPTVSFIVRIELLLNTLKMSSWNVCTLLPYRKFFLKLTSS